MKMKNKYIVYTQGEIIDTTESQYAISAYSEAEAKEKALECFNGQHAVVSETVSISIEKNNNKILIVGFAALLLSVFLSFIGWYNGHKVINIAPGFLSTIYAVLIYSAYIVRFKGLKETFQSPVDVAFCPLVLMIISSLISGMLNTNGEIINLFGLSITANALLLTGVILSWLGIKIVSLICFVVVLVSACANIHAINIAMGNLWGTVYIVSAYMGLLIYLSSDPSLKQTIPAIIHSVSRGGKHISNDYSASVQTIKHYKHERIINKQKVVSEKKDRE